MGKDYRYDKEWGSKKNQHKRAKVNKKGKGHKKKNSNESFSHLKKQDLEEYEDPDQGFEKFHSY